ncbi:DUF5379 domain-containing protein [Bradyrhizobium sp. SRS-191]|uniref:DUF5379 domain-containing protein n=1 Tax=Bradyrhizobium sp. SRS-191 TaxID=2962606 RepID=UPI00211DE029|nr:DUF5379 domain-containing protein [Bradyrhizobium sp. SRS-191]
MQAHQVPPRLRPIRSKPFTSKPVTSKQWLGAVVLAFFLILHIVAIAILRGADTPDRAGASPVATLQTTD